MGSGIKVLIQNFKKFSKHDRHLKNDEYTCLIRKLKLAFAKYKISSDLFLTKETNESDN